MKLIRTGKERVQLSLILSEMTLEQVPYTGITYNEKADLIFAENADYQTSILDNNYQVKATGILSEVNTEDEYIRMRINNDYKYYSLKGEETSNINVLKNNTIFLSKEDGKYGYVDKKGKPVTEYIYDDATEQNEYGYVWYYGESLPSSSLFRSVALSRIMSPSFFFQLLLILLQYHILRLLRAKQTPEEASNKRIS